MTERVQGDYYIVVVWSWIWSGDSENNAKAEEATGGWRW